jgi:hypothetical protein
VIVTLKIDDIKPRADLEFVIHRLERFFNDQPPEVRIDLRLEVLTNGNALEM